MYQSGAFAESLENCPIPMGLAEARGVMEKSPRLLMTKAESPGAAVRCLLWCNWIQDSEAGLSRSRGHSDLGIWGGVSSEHP